MMQFTKRVRCTDRLEASVIVEVLPASGQGFVIAYELFAALDFNPLVGTEFDMTYEAPVDLLISRIIGIANITPAEP